MDRTKAISRDLSRRAVIAGAAAVSVAAIRIRPAHAAEFSYKLATGQSITQPINARLDQACARIKEASAGRVRIAAIESAAAPVITARRDRPLLVTLVIFMIVSSPCDARSAPACSMLHRWRDAMVEPSGLVDEGNICTVPFGVPFVVPASVSSNAGPCRSRA